MIYNKELSVTNSSNRPEFFRDTSKPMGLRYNTSFYKSHQEVKMRKNADGGYEPFGILEIGAYQPQWAVTDTQWVNHNNSIDAMKTKSAYVPNTNVMFLSLKGIYSSIFCKIMASVLVARARELHWEPIFLLKNACLMESKDFGCNGWSFNTMDKTPKSYLTLLGFSKVGDPSNVCSTIKIISLTNASDQLLALK